MVAGARGGSYHLCPRCAVRGARQCWDRGGKGTPRPWFHRLIPVL
ncbi:hypothetical protein BDIM_00180 [Brevundimonas diminuta ATCC 11568]|nr:hypothetical protein BDIM_00180 [Brevundimonas diminuta ATCC 11568]